MDISMTGNKQTKGKKNTAQRKDMINQGYMTDTQRENKNSSNIEIDPEGKGFSYYMTCQVKKLLTGCKALVLKRKLECLGHKMYLNMK